MAILSAFYHLPPRVLSSIQAVDGWRPGLVSRNTNATERLGVMPVNAVRMAPPARQTGLPQAEIRRRLIHGGCCNIAAADGILRTDLGISGGGFLGAAGNDHSRTPSLHEAYPSRVLAASERLCGTVAHRLPSRPAVHQSHR